MQLFDRLKKIVDATVKLECYGCHKLIPTTQFYEHLLDSANDCDPLCHDQSLTDFNSFANNLSRSYNHDYLTALQNQSHQLDQQRSYIQ